MRPMRTTGWGNLTPRKSRNTQVKRHLFPAALVLTATTTLAQTTPGEQFMQTWDLDDNGAAMCS